MSLFDDLLYEFDAISTTILDYCSDGYIKNYLYKLKESIDSEDINILEITLVKLDDWYEKNIKDILNNDFVYNQKAHIKTKNIFKKYIQSIKNINLKDTL